MKSLNFLKFAAAIIMLIGVALSCGKKDPVTPNDPNDPNNPNNPNNPPVEKYYRIYNLESGTYLSTEQPHQVNMLFQVLDKNHKGVPGMFNTDAYIITEDGEKLSVEASPVIDTFGSIPFTIKTVLLLDFSSSVKDHIGDIKDAALAMIDSKISAQEMAIYIFDSKPKLIQSFTTNKELLKNALSSISDQNLVSSTNIYGSLVATSDDYQDMYTTSQIVQGSIVLFTDGKETTGEYEEYHALNAVANKQVYVLALNSPDLDSESLTKLSSDGSYVFAEDISQVKAKFLEIQKDIVNYSKSVYWLYYQSTKRKSATGNNAHSLEISIKDNENTGYDATAEGTYSSENFTD